MTLRVVPISLRGQTVWAVTDGVTEFQTCMTEAEAQGLIDASVLASTAILHSEMQA
jgi:hypothetical protein